MGFAVMESFMDSVNVASNNGKGVRVSMQKRIGEEIKEAICE